ncbi:MAG: hypothetical protein HYV60_08695, partial [Planctomycetia bacterium]|nr:hypothetical protein [Planctomycetia bacterium]
MTATTTEQRFDKALELWRPGDHTDWLKDMESHWLHQCAVLQYARQCEGDLNAEQRGGLQELATSSALVTQAEKLLDGLVEPKGYAEQLARLVRAVAHAVLAAEHIAEWLKQDDVNHPFLPHASARIQAFNQAWPLSTVPAQTATVKHDGRVVTGAAAEALDKLSTFVNGKSRKQALTAFRKSGAWNTSSWLIVRRLLAWIIGEDSDDDSQEPPGKNGADHERHQVYGKFLPIYAGGGIVLPFSIMHGYEGQAGFYLDPIKSGLPLLDATFCKTLNTACRVCPHAALERGQTWAATTLRMDTQIDPLHLLEDESAGGMFTIGMIVATKGEPLDEDASAAFTIKPSSRKGPTDPLGPDDIQLGHVGQADKKVHGAIKAELQRLYFYTGQPGIPKNRPITREIDSLGTAIQQMTRDAAKEKVLLAFAMEAAKWWQNGATPGPEQPARFIEPHYAWLRNESDTKDHTYRLAEMHLTPDETIHGNRLEPLLTDERRNSITLAPDNQKSVGDDELFELLHAALEEATARPLPESVLRPSDGPQIPVGLRLVLAEDANAGKTVFTKRLRYYFCDKSPAAGRQQFFSGAPVLVVRWENRGDEGKLNWPTGTESYGGEHHWRTKLEQLVEPFCDRLGSASLAQEVVTYALELGRVVFIFDALDQVDEYQKLMAQISSDDLLHRCHVIVTGRTFAFHDEKGKKA